MEISKKNIILLITCFIIMIIIWFINFSYVEFLKYKDNMDYSQMGRELARGNGFSTLQVFPGHLKFFKEHGFSLNDHIPNLYRFPLPVISNAAFQKIFNNPLTAGVFQSGFWMLMTIPFIFALLYKLAGLFMGVLGTLVFFLDNFVNSYSGLGESLTTFLLVSIFYFIFRDSKNFFLLPGILTGLLFLSRSVFIFILPVIVIYYISEKIKFNKILILISGFLIISGGWFVRNYTLTGSPLFSFTNIRSIEWPYTENRIDPFYTLEMEYSTAKIVSKNLDHVIKKTGSNMLKFFSFNFWKENIFPFAPFLFISILFYLFSRDRHLKKRARLVFLTVICTFIIYSPFLLYPRWFVPLKPLILIIFLAFVTKVFADLKKRKNLHIFVNYSLILVFSFIMIIPWILNADKISNLTSNKNPGKKLNTLVKLKRIVKGKVVLSDLSHKISLFCDTKAIRAPIDPNEIEKIDNEYLKIDYVVLSKKLPLSMKKNYSVFFKDKNYLKKFDRIAGFKWMYVLKRR